MIVSHPEVPSLALIHNIACDFLRFLNFSFHNHRQTQERQKKSFSFTLQVQIGTKRLQIEYTKESMVDDNNEKSFYSLQQKKRSGIEIGDGAEGWEYNEVGCDASVLVKNNKNFPLIYTKRKKSFEI